jgi:hypothetical protein
LLREYTRLDTGGKPTDVVALNVNYYPKGTATPHVPDICWVGNGLEKVYDEAITVRDVPHKDGTRSAIPMRLLSFRPPRQPNSLLPDLPGQDRADQERLFTVAYTLQVNGRYVGNRAQVAKLFWRTDSRYCYHTKIEITYSPNVPCARNNARPVIEEFLRAALPQIEECLPDWQKLNANCRAVAVVASGSPIR